MKIIGFNLGIADISWALRENDEINSLTLERRENKFII